MVVTGHESRAGGISPRKPLRLRARLMLCAIATLGLVLTAAAVLAPTPGSARDPREVRPRIRCAGGKSSDLPCDP